MTINSGLDETALDAYLHANLRSYPGPYSVSALSGGQSNPTFVLMGTGQKLVLRKKPGRALLRSAQAVDREYRVICALKDSGVPVAKAECYCDDAAVRAGSLWTLRLPSCLQKNAH